MSARFAIYYAPPSDGELWRFGSRVIGYDAATGDALAFLVPPPFDDTIWSPWTAEPRRYGFHGTLKAPFRLAEGLGADHVERVARHLSARLVPFRTKRARVALIGSFVALVPEEECPRLLELAASCLESFEPLRAPLTEAERARRLETPLSPRQIELLELYGYPYVLDQFRFHMTLTGTLPQDRAEDVRARLANLYERIEQNLLIDAICIFLQPAPGDRFRIWRRIAFGK